MNFEKATEYLGEFGKWQRIQYVLLILPGIWCGIHMLEYLFIGAVPLHRCYIPTIDDANGQGYDLDASIREAVIPWDEERDEWDQCRRHQFTDQLDNSTLHNPGFNWTGFQPANGTQTMECNQWIYDTSQYHTSLAITWDTVCKSRKHLYATVLTVQMAGVLVGAIGFGALSDFIGRKKVFVLSLFLQVIFGIATALVGDQNYYALLAVRFVMGTTTMGVFLVSFVITMEMIGPSYRTLAGVTFQAIFAIGLMILALIAYLIRDWFYLQLALTIPGVLFFSYIWLISESARWLNTNGKIEKAKEIVCKAAKTNNVTIPEDLLNQAPQQDIKQVNGHEDVVQRNANLTDLLRTPNQRGKSLNVFFNWFVVAMVYYGLSINSTNLVGSHYLNFFLSGVVELPGYALCIWTMEKFGRKLSLCGTEIIGGFSLIICVFIPKENAIWINILANVGKMMISGSFAVIYNFSAEIFPTVIRNNGMGVSSMCARIGSMLAPNIVLLNSYIPGIATVLMGIFSLCAGILALLLPETKGEKLPDTLEDGEEFGKGLVKKAFSKLGGKLRGRTSRSTNRQLELANTTADQRSE